MKGKATIIAPDGTETVTEFTAQPGLEFLKKAVGGFIEIVPYWNKFRDAECVVFCNEEGKLHNLPINRKATEHWHSVAPAVGDILLGSVLILTGDDEFLEAL